jgi:hypothetical protein
MLTLIKIASIKDMLIKIYLSTTSRETFMLVQDAIKNETGNIPRDIHYLGYNDTKNKTKYVKHICETISWLTITEGGPLETYYDNFGLTFL